MRSVIMVAMLAAVCYPQDYSSVLIGRGTEYPYDMCMGADGTGCVIVGTDRNPPSPDRMFLCRLGNDLGTVWQYYSPLGVPLGGYGICSLTIPLPGCPKARYAVAGYTVSDQNRQWANISLFDGAGSPLAGGCSFILPGISGCRAKDVVQLRSGDLAVVGETQDDRVFVAVLDHDNLPTVEMSLVYSDEDFETSYTYPGCILEAASSIGDFILAGVTTGETESGGPVEAPSRVIVIDNRPSSQTYGEILSTCSTC